MLTQFVKYFINFIGTLYIFTAIQDIAIIILKLIDNYFEFMLWDFKYQNWLKLC